tara:strand:+ start:328 stop:540 length:213 start_codon:yes stop_codon:yes gene_type:complete
MVLILIDFLPPMVFMVLNILCFCLLCSSSAQSIKLNKLIGIPSYLNLFYPSVWVTKGLGYTFDLVDKIIS